MPQTFALPRFFNFSPEDCVRLPKDIQLFFGNIAKDTQGKAASGEGLTLDNNGRQPQFFTHPADFILEQFPHGLNYLHTMLWGIQGKQRTGRQGIAVIRTLQQHAYVAQLADDLFQFLIEQAENDLFLFLGAAHTFQGGQEAFPCVHPCQVQPHGVLIKAHDPVAFALTQQAGIHKNAVQPGSNGHVAQQGTHAAVHAAG